MAEFEKIRSQVNRCLRYDYPGSPDDGDGANDEVWINKKQKYEVDYAIARCLWESKHTAPPPRRVGPLRGAQDSQRSHVLTPQ